MLGSHKMVALWAGLVLAQSGPAPVITNNHAGTTFTANLTGGTGGLQGSFSFVATRSGRGVNYSFNIDAFDLANSTEYSYHIHQKPVPDDGNCTATGGHFDQYGVADSHKCDPSQLETCQLGDLSGKYGIIRFSDVPEHVVDGTYSMQNVHDEFLSTSSNDTAFIGGRSIVVHRKSDSARLACGNLIRGPDTEVSDCDTLSPIITPPQDAATSTLSNTVLPTSEPASATSTVDGNIASVTNVASASSNLTTPATPTSSIRPSVPIILSTGSAAKTGDYSNMASLVIGAAAMIVLF